MAINPSIMQRYRLLRIFIVLIGLGCFIPVHANLERQAWGFTISEESKKWGFQAYSLMSEQQVLTIFNDKLKGVSKKRYRDLAKHLISLCLEYRFDPVFVMSVIETESYFNSRAVSGAGAKGLMQLMPGTALTVARWVKKYRNRKFLDRTDPFLNLELGIIYLSYLRTKYRSHFGNFLMAYNMGPGNMDKILRKKQRASAGVRHYVKKIRKEFLKWKAYQSQQSLAGLQGP